MSSPTKLRYSKDHEWVRIEGEIAYVGITDHAQDALGDIVYVEVPEIGQTIARGDEASNIESVKAAAPVYAPLSGSVSAINEALDGTPELLNQKPYETYIFAIAMSDPSEADSLLSSEDYESFLSKEKES